MQIATTSIFSTFSLACHVLMDTPKGWVKGEVPSLVPLLHSRRICYDFMPKTAQRAQSRLTNWSKDYLEFTTALLKNILKYF